MNVYEAIEAEFYEHLKAGGKPPKVFSITLDELEFLGLLTSVVNGGTQRHYPVETTEILLDFQGHQITVCKALTPITWVDHA